MESPREHSLNFDAVLYDGAALINILQPKTCNTFNQYATEIFCPVILSRLDIVQDSYHQGSPKAYTRNINMMKALVDKSKDHTESLITGSGFL